MELRIRLSTPPDAPTLARIARAARASWGYPAEWLDLWSPKLTLTPEYFDRHLVFLATVDGETAGCCALEDHSTHWMLEQVWIAPEAQRAGVGKALVRHALRRAADSRPGIVRVHADPNATDFFLGLGAELIGAVAAPMPGAPDRRLPVLEFEVAPR
ncbi:MAG: GNAT family N-acetyltransferase [Gemmatimonadales bacterium]|nr:GNAT family N-acetyltransferase [Gemmatimonadales bacterium]